MNKKFEKANKNFLEYNWNNKKEGFELLEKLYQEMDKIIENEFAWKKEPDNNKQLAENLGLTVKMLYLRAHNLGLCCE